MGPCPWTKFQVAFVVSLQVLAVACLFLQGSFNFSPLSVPPSYAQLFLAAYVAPGLSWPVLVLLAWSLGGTANSNLQLAMHEISHNLAFSGTTAFGMAANRILSIFANLPLAIPAAIAFRKYHLDHHRYQGTEGIDGAGSLAVLRMRPPSHALAAPLLLLRSRPPDGLGGSLLPDACSQGPLGLPAASLLRAAASPREPQAPRTVGALQRRRAARL